MLSSGNARLAAARRLTRRQGRRDAARFLAEGAQAVREALAAGAVDALFATSAAIERHPELTGDAVEISEKDAASLSETVTAQGLVAVCRLPAMGLDDVLSRRPRLLVVLVEPNEPGNLGAIVRTADAAGADAVLVDGGTDPFGGKAVRASAGSVFHLPVVAAATPDLLGSAPAIGLTTMATTGDAGDQLDDIDLAGPTVWLFGNEARGLPSAVLAAADRRVRIPIYGRAESLNLAAAAAVCLYASARAQRNPA